MSKPDRQQSSLLRTVWLVFPLLWILFPSQLHAATINVGPDEDHKTIQSALDDAQTGDTVFVEIGTYAENVVLQDGITIEGEETAGTKIVGTGVSGDTVAITGNSTISNMTIINTVTGSAAISISSNVTGVSITNNLIIGSKTGTGSAGISISPNVTGLNVTNNLIVGGNTGIQCAASSTLTITNNTIDTNTTGIACTGPTTMTFENNIVSNNTTGGINFTPSVTGVIDYNDVYNNGSNLYNPGTHDFNSDPKFADPTVNDYHLQTGSACLNAGDPSTSDPAKFDDKEVLTSPIDYSQNDCGAYGGPNRDAAPFQVQNVVPTTPGTDAIVLNWNANLAYNTANYNISFDNKVHTITNDIPSPPYSNSLTVAATTANCPSTSIPLTCTTTLSLPLTAPGNLTAPFGDQELFLSWNAPSGFKIVTGYNVYYMEQGGSTWTSISVGNVTSYTLRGLTNGTTYDVKVTAVASPSYVINATALDDFTTPHESHLLVPDVSVTINCSIPSCESPDSNITSGTPESIAPFPDLPDQDHCFIATAAYGSSWEPHVIILRIFRDEYLKPYDWGRRFIAWYYRHSPPWARYLNEHAWLKPMVRITLVPAVGLAYFFVKTTTAIRLLSLLLMLCLLGGTLVMRRMKRSRG